MVIQRNLAAWIDTALNGLNATDIELLVDSPSLSDFLVIENGF